MGHPVELHLNRTIIDSLKRLMKKNQDEGKKEGKKSDTSHSISTSAPATWVAIDTQYFESIFPAAGSNWYAFDNDGATNGEYFWDDDDYLPSFSSSKP